MTAVKHVELHDMGLVDMKFELYWCATMLQQEIYIISSKTS